MSNILLGFALTTNTYTLYHREKLKNKQKLFKTVAI